ncbi:uncharacterized protein [Panulirus ornatus]|uniref:uncharacterized protein isoform X2 n=1 Tax=Panulirus ornatus TaxID=150431 RepID=UPI003A8B6731
MQLLISIVLVTAVVRVFTTPDSTMPETVSAVHTPEDDIPVNFCRVKDYPNNHTPVVSYFRLETIYEHEGQTTQLLLRAPARCHHSSSLVTFTFTLQRSPQECTTRVNSSYFGRAVQATLTGAWSSTPKVKASVREGWSSGPEHTLPHKHLLFTFKTQHGNEHLRVLWDGVAKSVILTSPKFNLILSSGVEGKVSEPNINSDDVYWWSLCVQSWDDPAGGHSFNSQRRWQASAGTTMKDDGIVEVLARQSSVTVDHQTRLTRFTLDLQLGGKLQNLLNFTFHSSSHHKGWQQVLLQFPVLQLLIEAEVSTKRNQTNQYVDITAEIRNSATEATIKFFSWEVTAILDNETDDSCGSHNENGTGISEGNSEVCPAFIEPESKASPGTTTKRNPKSARRVQEVRQVVASDMFNLKSNLTIDATTTEHHIVRIHQDAYSPFCPVLSWSLNQIFNFSKDFSGWEYVVSQWAWGNMVVKGEWGVSPLQWYQKIFSFSLDQAAPLPSTHLVLDFRNFSRFLVLVRCPTLATALTASVNIYNSHYILQVKEVDEFRGEDDRVLLEVAAKKNQGGLTFTWTLDAEKTTHLYTVATTLLSQAASHPWMCDDSLVRHPIRQFLEDLLGQNLDHLWATLVEQGRHVLLWLNHGMELDYVWKILLEELAACEVQLSSSHGSEESNQAALWACVWAAAERLSVLKKNPEGEGVVVDMECLQEWSRVAQRFWEFLMTGITDECPVFNQLSVILEELMSKFRLWWLYG